MECLVIYILCNKWIHFISGTHQHHADIARVQFINAVCCSSKYIFVTMSQPPMLSVYTWDAIRLCGVDHTALQLTSDDILCAVGSVSEDSIMLAICGNIISIDYLQAGGSGSEDVINITTFNNNFKSLNIYNVI